jgi:hypothetical protein
MEVDVAIGAIASTQYGLVTIAQAANAGLSAKQRQVRVATRRWERVQPGVYALAGTPVTWEQRVMAAVLAGGDGTVASHLAAAALHRYPDVGRELVEVIVPPGRQVRLERATAHRLAALPDYERRVVAGIQVTSYARTLVDCSGQLSLGQLARALDQGLVRHELTLWSLERSLSALKQAPGRHPSKLWKLLSERGAETELAESPPEARMAKLLSDAGFPAAQQHWVRLEGENFRLDLAYPGVRVALEYDGWDTHRTRAAFDADRRRDRLLQLAGWTVLRFTSQSSDDEIITTIRSVCS